MWVSSHLTRSLSRLAVKVCIVSMICIMSAGVGDAAVPSLGDRPLSLGSWGADVFQLQQELIRFGYDLIADGHFGRGTQRAVIAFQLAYRLNPDGIVGSKTAATLLGLRPTAEYVVEPGDSLWAIARRFDTTIDHLIRTNQLPDGPLLVGTRLNVPTPLEYKVQAGDSLSVIARRYGTTTTVLAQLNNISDPNHIWVGMTLRLPHDTPWRTPDEF